MSNFPQKITSVIKTFSSFIIVSLIAVLVVSCASSSKGGGTSSSTSSSSSSTTTTPGISVFSHSSYTFIHENANITRGDTPETVGRVLPKHAEIRKLVAAEIGVEADDIVENNYTIKYSFAGDDAENPSSLLNRYFSIDSDGIITVENPFAFPVSLEDIFIDVPFVEVEMEITIRHANADKPLTRTVRVNFRSTDDALPGIDKAFSFDVTKVSEDDREEKQPLMEDITYTGELSGTLTDTALNGTDALIFTSLWKTATATPAENPTDGTIRDNVFTRITANDLLGLLNATETGLIQSIRVTFTPPSGAAIPVYVYASAANASAHVSIEELNGNNTVAGSLLKAISDADVNNHYTMINADGVQVLNASIGWSFTYTYQRDFQPNPITILGKVELNRTTQFEEEQSVTKNIPIDGVKTALDSYGFTTKATEQRTIFFTLLPSPDDPTASCASNNVYLDNEDSQVKAGTSFNYEDLDTEAERLHKCILAASFTGVDADYQALIAEINATTLPDARVNSNPAPGVTCDEGFNCYYATLTVNITDVDEAPTIMSLDALEINEGVGPIAGYREPVLTPIGDGLSVGDANGLINVSGAIIIADTDKAAIGGDELPVDSSETKVVSVSPSGNSHPDGLFSIVERGVDNQFTLRVNATRLDFEAFKADELNAAGDAIYTVTIATQDIALPGIEGFTDAKDATMDVEVKVGDIIYAPVDTGEGQGFTRNANIENRSGDTVVLLPGASMLANGRSVLGIVKAVNPETDSDAGLFYAAMSDRNPNAEVNNFAVVTGLGDGTTPQNLILRGLNLVNTDDFNLTVRAFSAPPRFNSRDPVAVQTALGTSIFTGTGVSIVIPIVVDADAYVSDTDANINISREDLLDPAISPTFTMRQLLGNITEKTAGDNVKVDVPANFPIESIPSPTPLVLYNPATPDGFELVNVPSDTTAAFALVTEAEIGAFGDTSALGITPSDANLFNINSSTGVISLKEGSEVVFPAFYNLVVRLANASDTGDIPSISLVHDYAVVSVLVNDENSAPVVSDFTALANPSLSDSNETADSLRLNITIDEDTPAGTVLATFTVTDDNDGVFAEQDFSFGADRASGFLNNIVKLTFMPVAPTEGSKERVSTATLTLAKSINFEDFADGIINPNNVVIADDQVTLSETSTISDKGRYEFNPLIGQLQPTLVSPPDDIENTPLNFNLIVRDVDEKPLIDTENSVIIGSVMEDAPVPAIVTGISITIANVNATNADALVYELSGNDKFAEVFNVTENAVSNANTRILNLIVADADALEDLGDGLVHTATLTITNNTGGTGPNDASDPITIQVMVIDVQQQINPIDLSTFVFNITETDVDEGVADGSYDFEEPLFTFIETDISKDANEKVTIGRTTYDLINIDYSITNVSFTSLTPDVADHIDLGIPPVFSLKKPDGDGNVTLAINDTDYIEASLFGDITSIVTFIGTAAGRSGGIVMNEGNGFTLLVLKAAPKEVAYTTANANANAPVYGFEYTQSDYADVDAEVAEDAVGENVTLATNVKGENGLNDPVGGRANQINVDGDNYNTTLVSVPSNSDININGYFIERDNSEALSTIDIPGSAANEHAVHDGTLVIRLDSNNDKNITITEILSEDPSGKLVDITTFDNYFNIEINNTYTLDAEGNPVEEHKVLLITQKQFDVINSTGGVDASIKYNALDTIALFKDATEETTRTYYIRASQEGDNASTYALAQFYVDIEAAGLNIPAVIDAFYIHTDEVALSDFDTTPPLVNFAIDGTLLTGSGSISENNIDPNQFGTYKLFMNISNIDYGTNEEGNTVITVSVLAGGEENDVSDTNADTTNGNLIKLAADNSIAPAKGASSVPLTQDDTSEVHEIAFALARNVYGTATININIQENDDNNKEIESQDYTFTLTVNKDTFVNNDPTITPMLTDGTITEPLSFDFQEDTDLLDGASPTKPITIMPGNVNIDADAGDNSRRTQAGNAVITGIRRMDGQSGSNTKGGTGKNIFDNFAYDAIASTGTMEYQEHGWGITDINFRVTETEPRGFGDAITFTLYDQTIPLTVTVRQVNDDATMHSIESVTYSLSEFQVNDAFSPTQNPEDPKTLIITYNDPDLLFADFSTDTGNNVLPEKIVAGVPVITPNSLDATLSITPAAGSTPTAVTGSDTRFMVTFTTDFAALNSDQYIAIATEAVGANYAVEFTGNDADNVPVDILIATTVNNFVVQDSSDAVFESGTITGETLSINENQLDNSVIATINIEDLDFGRPLSDAEKESIVFTIGTIEKMSGESNLETKIEWSAPTLDGTPDAASETERSNTITVDRLNDADVGTYKVNWMITQGLGTNSPLIGSFILDVQNVPEPLTLGDAVVTINYPVDGDGTLPTFASLDNRTIATVSGITIGGDDLNLPDDAGFGVLFTLTPKNIEGATNFLGDVNNNNGAGLTDGTKDRPLIEFVDADNDGLNARFTGTKPGVTYFVETSEISRTPGNWVLPAFNLLADEGVAGDEFNVTVSAVLATGIADAAITGADVLAGEKEFATEYDIQSPPSNVSISAVDSFILGGSDASPTLTTTEGEPGSITVTFDDRNIENNLLETFEGDPIEAFTATIEILNGEELISTETVTSATDGFTYSGGDASTAGNGTVTIPFTSTNSNVGDRTLRVNVTDSRTADAPTSVASVEGTMTTTGANSAFTIETRLNTEVGTPGVLVYDADNTPNIEVLVRLTSEDFVEGGVSYDVSEISFAGLMFNATSAEDPTVFVDCPIVGVTFGNAAAMGSTTGETREFVLQIPLTDLDSISDQPECARLDYNLADVVFDGDVGIVLSNDRDDPYDPTKVTQITTTKGEHTYTRTGMRTIAPSVSEPSDANVVTGEMTTIEFTVTDGDPDDGDSIGRYTITPSYTCAGWTVNTPNRGFTLDAITAYTMVVVASDGTTGTCSIDLVATEDSMPSDTVTVTVTAVDIAPPTIVRASGGVSNDVADAGNRVIPVSGTSVNQELGTFTITRQVTSAEITTYGLALNVFAELGANCGGITVSNGTQSGDNYPFTYTIGSGATEAAVCEVTITATETTSGGSPFSNTRTVTITPRREVVPGVVLSIPANLDGLTNYNVGFTATATITDGDDDDGFADVFSNLTSTNTDVCTVDESTHQSGSPSETINRAVTIVGMPGESCELLLTSTANGEENTTDANVVLPQLAPTFTVNNYPTDNVALSTNVEIIVTISDTDNDGVDGAVASIIPSSPSANCNYGAAGGVTTGADGEIRTFMVSSSTTNTVCDISVSVTENDKALDSMDGSIRFTVLADAAPSITRKEPNATMANINEIVSLTVNISNTDMDPLVGAFISAGSAGSSGCTVVPAADIVIYSDSETGTQLFNITSATAGECIITVNTTEGAFTSANEQVGPITFIRPEVAPTFTSVLPYLSGRKIGNAAAFELDIRIDDGDRMDGFANASITASSNPRDCTIAQVGNIEFVADGSRATQTFSVEGVSVGDCLLEFTAAENTTVSYDAITVEFIERVGPKVLDIFLTDSNADATSMETSKQIDEMFYINITIENVDDADDLVSNTINPNPAGCTVTPASELKVRGKDDTGADLTQAFIVAATLPGTCTIRARASNNKTGDTDSEEFTFAETLTFTKVPLIVENVEIRIGEFEPEDDITNVRATVGQVVRVNVTISDTDGQIKVQILNSEANPHCLVETKRPSHTQGTDKGYFVFTISSHNGASTCELNITAIEDSMESDVYTPRPIITFTEPGDAGPIALAWSDQVNESPFNGYMSIGNAGNSTITLIPNIPGLKRSTRFVPTTIGSRLAVVQTRFRPIDFNPVNYGETKFALSDGELGDTANLVRQFLVQVERDEYVTQGSNVVSRDTLLFYADTSSNHFDNGVLSTGAQTALETAGIERYLRFTTIAPDTGTGTVKSSGNVRGVTTIPFAATYDNEKRLVRTENNRENFILPGGDSANPVSVNVSRYAGVTDLININVSNVPAAGAKISASICRLEGFDGAGGTSTGCTPGSTANAAEIKNILLLGGYWDREPYTSCEATSAPSATTDFYGWYKNKKGERDDYYCTATTTRDAHVVPKTLISGATHENTLAAGSGNTEFPMHIRHFMNTLPVDTQVGDDYSLNERNGYYLITIQAQNSSGTKIPGSNELKMLFHIGWEFPPAE